MRYSFHFEDPYRVGGFGASTAQFAIAYAAGAGRLGLSRDWRSVWRFYRNLTGTGGMAIVFPFPEVNLCLSSSSGMDVAAVLANAPIVFEKGCPPRILKLERIPHFTLHDTGLRSNTSDCISRVKTLVAREPRRAAAIDRAMNAASYKALKGLLTYGRGKEQAGLETIAEGMRMALDCFGASAWNLIPEAEEQLIGSLLAGGALAAKPTGAGGGGAGALGRPEVTSRVRKKFDLCR